MTKSSEATWGGPGWLLYSHERRNMDADFHEITEDNANRIVEQIRRAVTGEH